MSAGYSNTNKFALLFAPTKNAGTKQPPPKAVDEKVPSSEKTSEKKSVDRKKTDNKPARARGDGQRNNNRGPRNTEGRPPRNAEDRKERPQKRQFDRRSGTGRPPTEQKKGNYGKGNWGTAKDAYVGEKEGPTVVEAILEGSTEETPVVEEVPEVKTLTLAEFEKQKQENAVKIDRPAPRVVEEDADLLKKFTKLDKKAPADKTPKKEKDTKEKASKKQFVPLNEILDVKAPQPPQNDRFARGQKGKKPAPRGGNRSKFTFDEGAFPPLG